MSTSQSTQRPETGQGTQPTSARSTPHQTPRPTSGRENSGLMFFFIGAAVLALLLVLFFNVLGPDGASRTGVADGPARAPAGQTIGGPGPADSQPGVTGTPGGSGGASTGGAAPAETPAPARTNSTEGAPGAATGQQGTAPAR